jgi:hypothetical protein
MKNKSKSLIVASLLTAVTGAVMLDATPAAAAEQNSIEDYCDYPLANRHLTEDPCLHEDHGGNYTS